MAGKCSQWVYWAVGRARTGPFLSCGPVARLQQEPENSKMLAELVPEKKKKEMMNFLLLAALNECFKVS